PPAQPAVFVDDALAFDLHAVLNQPVLADDGERAEPDVVADRAAAADRGPRAEAVARADPRGASGQGGVDVGRLAEDVRVADLDPASAVSADRDMGMELVVPAEHRRAGDVHAGAQPAAGADADPGADDAEGPDLDVVGDRGLGV